MPSLPLRAIPLLIRANLCYSYRCHSKLLFSVAIHVGAILRRSIAKHIFSGHCSATAPQRIALPMLGTA
jgi:hypothetical protein